MTRDPSNTTRNLEDFAGIASDWFWETDIHHRFTYLSGQIAQSLGISPDKMLGKCLLGLTTDDMSDQKWRAHIDDLDRRRPFRGLEFHITRDDGSIVWIKLNGEPTFDAEGQFTGYRGTGHDMTAEKLKIAQFEAANAALQLRNTQLDTAREALERSAHEDILTDVWNRRAFERDIHDLLECTDRNAGLIQIDLDQFKWVNDTLGHPAGDTVLKTAAARIKAATHHLGTTYRVGGDEFIIILCDHVTEHRAILLGHDITNAMATPIPLGHHSVRIGVSVGVAVAEGADTTAADLIRQADAALYEAKEKGRNAVCAASAALRRRLETYTWIAADLPHAIERDELVPYFQPQCDLLTGKIIGVEALVRWHHPEKGIVFPHQFLKVSAELALCDQIDRQMLIKGFAAVDRLSRLGIAIPSLSINTSQARLLDPRLLTDVGCIWTNPNCSLSLELLETISFDDCCDANQLTHNLNRLRAMGVQIEMDDFGSARASITGLLKVGPDRLKIDKHLVQEVVGCPEKRTLIRTILDLAQGLNIACIAEGAEDEHALTMLRDLGCTQVQGYAITHPLTEAELAVFLRRNQLATLAEIRAAKRETAGPLDLPQSA